MFKSWDMSLTPPFFSVWRIVTDKIKEMLEGSEFLNLPETSLTQGKFIYESESLK